MADRRAVTSSRSNNNQDSSLCSIHAISQRISAPNHKRHARVLIPESKHITREYGVDGPIRRKYIDGTSFDDEWSMYHTHAPFGVWSVYVRCQGFMYVLMSVWHRISVMRHILQQPDISNLSDWRV